MKSFPTAAALLLLAATSAQAQAAPSGSAPHFALVMAKDCQPGDPQHPYVVEGTAFPMCLADKPFLTGQDVVAASAVALKAAPPTLAHPHDLHLTLTEAAGRRLTDLSYDNQGESFVSLVDGRIIALTSIGPPFHGTEVDLLVDLDDASFVALVAALDKKP